MPRLGPVMNEMVAPVLIDQYGVSFATWSVSLAPVCLTFLSACYLVPLLSAGQKRSLSDTSFASMKILPRSYWQLAWICVFGYACMNTFGNSAQRFLAAWSFNGDQVAAGRSLRYVLPLPMKSPLLIKHLLALRT